MPGPQSADAATASLTPATPGITPAPAPAPPRRLLPMAVALQTLISAGDGPSLGMAAAGSVLTPLGPRLVLLIAGSGGVLAGAAGLLLHRRRAAGAAQTAAHSTATVVD